MNRQPEHPHRCEMDIVPVQPPDGTDGPMVNELSQQGSQNEA